MAFDQYIEAKSGRLGWLTDDFAEAWRPLISGAFSDGEPIEVIGYLGDLDGDDDFVALKQSGEMGAWLRRATVSVAPLLDAGMSVGFDSSASVPQDSPEYGLIRLLNRMGVRTYIEARPSKSTPHLWNQNVVITNQFWKRSDPARHPQSSGRWAARNEDLTGEIVRIIRFPERDVMGQLKQAREAWADGHTVAWSGDLLLEHGWDWHDLLHRDIPDGERPSPDEQENRDGDR